MNALKRIASIVFLLSFLFDSMGYFFVFKVNQSIIRSNNRGLINSGYYKEQVILIKIKPGTDHEFKKLDHDEISYKGRLYDVVSESARGSVIWYYCVIDSQEESLIAGFEKMQSFPFAFGTTSNSKQLLTSLHRIVTPALICESKDSIKPGPVKAEFHQFVPRFYNIIPSPLPPPPEFS